MIRPLLKASLCAIAALVAAPAHAQFDYSISGFGTIGYAKSNSDAVYDRYIDNGGTLRRDSLAGLQVDAKAFDDFGATIQIKGAPSTTHDRRYEASVSWAFLSWRPTNDWLVRVGKQRIPYYLYSESFDVGASFDFARLPIEMYSITPSNDVTGIRITRTLQAGTGEFSFEAFYGRSTNRVRTFVRDEIPGFQERGPYYVKLIFTGGGGVAAYHDDKLSIRFSAIRANGHLTEGAFPGEFPFVQIAPGVGYYQVSDAQPGPGVLTTGRVTDTVFTGGIEAKLPVGFQLTSEFTHITSLRSTLSPRGNRGYAALLRPIDRWTPYVYYSFLRSPKSQRDLYTAQNDNRIPPFIPGASVINASQRAAADANIVYDQSSWALGTSYSLTPSSKLKAEFLRTRVGDVSSLLDVSSGDTPRHKKINTLSLSYSVVFQ